MQQLPLDDKDISSYPTRLPLHKHTMEAVDARTRNLRKLHRSKQVWESLRSISSDASASSVPAHPSTKNPHNQELNYKQQYPYTGPSHGEDYSNSSIFWRACDAGDAHYVGTALGRHPRLIRRCRGVLHIACFHADYPTLNALTKCCPKWVLNDTRSAYDKSTPLMECARGKQGDATWRVECFRELVLRGADLTCKDANDNTCLHWAVRSGNLLLVKFILLETDGSAILLNAKNVKGQLPVDLVDSCSVSKYTQGRMKEIIEKVQCGSSIRKRLQMKVAADAEGHGERIEALHADSEITLEEVFASFAASKEAMKAMFVKAEQTRQADEDTCVNAAFASATESAIASLDESALRTLTAQIREELRQQVKNGRFEGKKPHNISALARRRAEQLILRRKQRDASDRAMIEFRHERPVVDVAAQMRKLPK